MPTPKQRPQKPLDVFADQVAEVIAVTKRRAFILDLAGQLRYAEDGAERPSPVAITMPGMPLIVADPQVHRRLDAAEEAHSAAVHPAISAIYKQYGPAAERAMFWKGAGAAYHDFTRHGPVIIWRYGMNNAFNEKRRICRGSDEQAAIDLLADHCRRRKYVHRSGKWFGLLVRETDGLPKLSLAVRFPWKRDIRMDNLTQGMVLNGNRNLAQSRPGGRAPNGSKIGRNDPCPCGSGKKFKKCCIA